MKAEPALITGASSGIGLALARIMARNGHALVLTARGVADLEKAAAELRSQHGATVHVVASDLSRPEAPQALFDEVARLGLDIGILVNNAGYSTYGPFVDIDSTADLNMLALNVVALTHLTRLFLPGMVARRSGRVLNVASTAAFQPGPYMACYYASKAYVLSFSEAIGEELAGSGVTVAVGRGVRVGVSIGVLVSSGVSVRVGGGVAVAADSRVQEHHDHSERPRAGEQQRFEDGAAEPSG